MKFWVSPNTILYDSTSFKYSSYQTVTSYCKCKQSWHWKLLLFSSYILLGCHRTQDCRRHSWQSSYKRSDKIWHQSAGWVHFSSSNANAFLQHLIRAITALSVVVNQSINQSKHIRIAPYVANESEAHGVKSDVCRIQLALSAISVVPRVSSAVLISTFSSYYSTQFLTPYQLYFRAVSKCDNCVVLTINVHALTYKGYIGCCKSGVVRGMGGR